jgi:hypothetical protein
MVYFKTYKSTRPTGIGNILYYDPKDHTLSFSPEDVQFLEGPGGIS